MLFDKKKEKLLTDSRLLGRWGQKQCEKFLRQKGYKTITRNFSCKTGEIDLIMTTDSKTVVFVEVKTRKNEDFADAEAAITSAKKQRMKKAANLFVKKYKLDNRPLRFDVVIVIADQKADSRMRHYENAF
ncbi:MAG: YraN family protein [Sedimentisphaerales bacterium]|nr:YraN family protein [Sedimentisphaerales bacterium]